MRTLFALAAGVAAVSLAGAASAQVTSSDVTPSANPNVELGKLTSISDTMLRQMTDGQCYLSSASYDYQTGAYDFGPPVKANCLVSVVGPYEGAAVATGSPVSARVPQITYGYMPLTWQGTWEEWREHQDQCARHYRSYDPMTDMFVTYGGVSKFCQLGLVPLEPQ